MMVFPAGRSASAPCVCRKRLALRQAVWSLRLLHNSTRCQELVSLSERRTPVSHGIPSTPCRTRFAPSPTGSLHLGSLRTALYNYLLAKASGGQFILRIEDTDQTRRVEGAEKKLMGDLKWAGLSWDEGPDVGGDYGPYTQSQRLAIYDDHITTLLAKRKAYRCFCPAKVQSPYDQRGSSTVHQPSGCPGNCRHVSDEEAEERAANGEAFTVKFRTRKPPQDPRNVPDLVWGTINQPCYENDVVIRKSDGFPTYHFANVVDDKLMEITHVIRGAEWLASTPLHAEIYDALGWSPPKFAHLALLVDFNKQKLSKRMDAAGLDWYRERDILPAAVVNFAALLGWDSRSPVPPGGERHGKGRSQVMDLEEMVKAFSLKFTRGEIIVMNRKLRHLQEKHYAKLVSRQLADPSSRDYLLDNVEALIRDPSVPLAKRWIDTPERTQVTHFTEVQELMPCLAYITDLDLDQPSMVGEARRQAGREYLIKLFQAHGASIGQLDHFVRYNRYLIWQPPRVLMEHSICTVDAEISVGEEAISLHDAVRLLKEATQSLPDDMWTEKEWRGEDKPKGNAVTDACKSMALVAKDKDEHNKFSPTGYTVLRWAMVGGSAGGSMTAVMPILGRDECLRRLELAMDVAAEWEVKKAAKAATAEAVEPEDTKEHGVASV